MPRPRILFYCQSLVGVGHLTASLRVIREMLCYAEVDLIYGGQAIELRGEQGLRILSLAALLLDDTLGELFDPEGQRSVEDIWCLRAEQISHFLEPSYAAIIVEFFPFGRRRFKAEIYRLFSQVMEQSGDIPIFSFVREVLVPESLAAEQRMVESVNAHIHTVFVRGDPQIIDFAETFSLTSQIAHKIVYVGYLGTEQAEKPFLKTSQILVSQGGGNVGGELLKASIRTAPLLPDYQFLIALGAKATSAELAELQGLTASANVSIVPFLQDYQQQLLQSALSISMGGDNTLIEVISAHTPGLAYPYPGNSEQAVRIQKLADKGLIHALTSADLVPEKLRTKILAALSSPYSAVNIGLNGAVNMSEHIKAIVMPAIAH